MSVRDDPNVRVRRYDTESRYWFAIGIDDDNQIAIIEGDGRVAYHGDDGAKKAEKLVRALLGDGCSAMSREDAFSRAIRRFGADSVSNWSLALSYARVRKSGASGALGEADEIRRLVQMLERT